MPKISVIIPVYQVEQYLPRCVESLLAQTFQDFECILVNDGSTDGSGRMCDNYARKDGRFSVIHKANGGLSSARNAALAQISGDYLCFFDSDDVLHPQALEWMVTVLERTDADLVSAPLEEFSTDQVDFWMEGEPKTALLYQTDFIDHLLPENFGRICVTACGKLYRRRIFDHIRYPEGEIYEDLHVYLNVLLQCRKIAVLDRPLYYYYTNPASITRSSYLRYDRFGEFQVREGYISFFQERGLENQALLAQNDYLTFFLRNAFAVLLRYPERKDALKPEMRTFRGHLKQILRNPHVCRMRKVCAAGILIAPRLVYHLARRTIPDCLIEEMR